MSLNRAFSSMRGVMERRERMAPGTEVKSDQVLDIFSQSRPSGTGDPILVSTPSLNRIPNVLVIRSRGGHVMISFLLDIDSVGLMILKLVQLMCVSISALSVQWTI